MRISAIIKAIEEFAPPSYQESWDNTGLQVGNPATECTGVLICLDPTPAIVDEAISLDCNLIVSHHPLFFKGVKRLTGTTAQQATAINAITAGITIYSSHTAADSTQGGVSYALAAKLGVKPLRALEPLADRLVWLRVIAPVSHAEEVRAALFDAGAGAVGSYDCCSFNTPGTGTFRPLYGSNPYIGTLGESHTEQEVAIDVVLPVEKMAQVESVMLEVHPYETPAYQFVPMLNRMRHLGLGIYGTLEEEVTAAEFIKRVKDSLGCKAVRTTPCSPTATSPIRRVAVCGGAGGSLIPQAKASGAQVYVTADLRYHDFVDNAEGMLIIDAGHYETEAPVKQVLLDLLHRKFPTVTVRVSGIEDNPVRIQ